MIAIGSITYDYGIPDSDDDGVNDDEDNCPSDYNPLQEDLTEDGVGDICDDDDDKDNVPDLEDNCPEVANSDQTDSDVDGTGDACDAGTAVDLIEEELVAPATIVIVGIETLSGGNGMIAKLRAVVGIAGDALEAYEAGEINAADYVAALN